MDIVGERGGSRGVGEKGVCGGRVELRRRKRQRLVRARLADLKQSKSVGRRRIQP